MNNISNRQLLVIGGSILVITIVLIVTMSLLSKKSRSYNKKKELWDELKNLSPGVGKDRLIDLIYNDGVEGCSSYDSSSGNETMKFAEILYDELEKHFEYRKIAHIYIFKLENDFGRFRDAQYVGNNYEDRMIFNALTIAYKNCVRL